MRHWSKRLLLVVGAWCVASPSLYAQTTTYHLHAEASTTSGWSLLATPGPDAATSSFQSANLQSAATGEKLVREFDTASGVPNIIGTIPSGTTVTFQVWMRKTASLGTMVPRAKLRRNNASGTSLCTATGATALTTTLTSYTLTCTIGSDVALASTDRLYVWTGVNLTTGSSGGAFAAQVHVEGVLNGSADSQVAIPNPLPRPAITSLTPNQGPIGQVVTIAGSNFGATQGASTVRFGTRTATVSSWSSTSITATVPAMATTGNVTVTVRGTASVGVSFTVLPTPTITSLSSSSGAIGATITINGSNFGATRGTSAVTFNGTPATTFTTWNSTRIVTVVPSAATSGPIVVTVGGVPSAGTAFTVTAAPTITSVTPDTGSAGTSVTIAGTDFGATQPTNSNVRFSTATATVTATITMWSSTNVTATVPTAAITGTVTLTASGIVSNAVPFTAPPVITTVSPDPAATYATMTITGTNFASTTSGVTVVNFGPEYSAWPSTASATSVTVIVPGPPYGNNGGVKVAVAGVESNVKTFTWVPPAALHSVTPDTAAVGTEIELRGLDFGATQGTSTVRVNGALTTPTFWSSTRITAPVPAGATASGTVAITKAGATSNYDFTVVPRPAITLVVPTSGASGTPITITGTDFGATPGSVRSGVITFNGFLASPTTWSDTSITVPVPAGATTGPLIVTVGADASNVVAFVVPVIPTIHSLSADAGAVGTGLAITGVNLGTTPGTLTFNGTAATVTTWTDTFLVTTVPVGATTGPVVVTASSVPSAGVPFAVTVAGSLGGHVTRQSDGSPVSATVQARRDSTVVGSASTDPSGAYTIADLIPGVYSVKTTSAGLGTAWAPAVAVASGPNTVDVVLTTPGSITGRILQTDGVTPIAGAVATLLRDTVVAGTVPVDGTGAYTFGDMAPGTYAVDAKASGFVGQSRSDVPMTAGTATTVDFNLTEVGQQPINYLYDRKGRLSAVVDRGGDAAVYTYDAVGNVIGIERRSATGTSIVDFFPQNGLVGTEVTLLGTGFSSNTVDHAVTINSAAMTVVAATPTSLRVVVPSGATTGLIAVSNANGSDTTDVPFTVTSLSQAPTITGFTPTSGWHYEEVTITGTHFQGPTTTQFRVNGTAVQTVTAISETSATVQLPFATSGRLSVQTAFGKGTSTGDFIMTNGPFDSATRMNIGDTIAVPLGTTRAFVLFDGVAGQRVCLMASGMAYMYFSTPRRDVSMGLVCPGELPLTGTYSMELFGGPGTATVATYNVPPDATGAIAPGDPPITRTTTVPGQRIVLTFDGTALHDLALTFSGGTIPTCTINVRPPSGGPYAGFNCQDANGYKNLPPLPETGTYRIEVYPHGTSIGSLTFALTFPAAQAIGTDGTPVSVTTTSGGQTAEVLFAGTAGQRVSVTVDGDTMPCGSRWLLGPGGAGVGSVTGGTCVGRPDGFVDVRTLSVAGTYAVILDPSQATGTGGATFRVYTVPADVQGTTTVGGPPVPTSMTVPGQNALVTFAGTASQSVTVSLTGNTFAAVNVSLLSTDGTTVLATASTTGGTVTLPSVSLPSTGSYTVRVDPVDRHIGAATVAIATP
jgi:YD repeat-containing protein